MLGFRAPLARRWSVLVCTLACLHSSRASADEVTPPAPRSRVDAVLPAGALAPGEQATVSILVTVAADGMVAEASVDPAAAPPPVADASRTALEEAALAAIRQWTFEPARSGDVAVAARIRVPFLFVAPPPPPPPPPAPPPAPAPPPPSRPAARPPVTAEPVMEVDVRGHRVQTTGAPSDFVVQRAVLAAAPHQSAGDVLQTAPGVYTARPEGEAIGHEIFLRGFDAEHGQDIELTVGGMPINQPSHVHGQGYADTNFIIPETIRSIRVTEGVYDPRQGDFAVAGSIDFDLAVPRRGVESRTSLGSFGTLRQLVLWAPPDEAEETFAAFQYRRSDGFGENRGSIAGSALGQLVLRAPGGIRTVTQVSASGARAGLAGVLRRDDVDAGRVGFYDSYPQPTANAQSGFGARTSLSISADKDARSGARTGVALWLLLQEFSLRENFTGFLERSNHQPLWVGRGDLVGQYNHDLGLGGRLFHRTAPWLPVPCVRARFELGLTFRTDSIDQQQDLLRAPQNEVWDHRVDATIRGTDVGLYADADATLWSRLRLRGGVRGDVLYYDADDRLGNFSTRFRREDHILGFRRSALGLAIGPRASAELRILHGLRVMAAYGEGYRSPQARQLEEGENAPYAKVRSAEVGARWSPWSPEQLTLTGAVYATLLSLDLAFDPGEGGLERIGPTTRKGAVLQVSAQPWRGAIVSTSLTLVHATLDEPPPATAENPSPPFETGQLLPYVPPVVFRADLGQTARLARFGGGALEGRLGVGVTALSARPLPYGQFADPVLQLDATASVRWRFFELALEAWNVLDQEYATTEYSFVSDWQTHEPRSLVPAQHFSAGSPRALLATLGVSL